MAICKNCQTENKPEDRFCQGCGEPLMTSQDTKSLIDTGIVCPTCDTFNEPNQKQCVKCDQSLAVLTDIFLAMGKAPPEPEQSFPKITLIQGVGNKGAVFSIGTSELSVGRRGATVVMAEDPFLSPVHAVIKHEKDRLIIKDAGSLNGTFLRIRNPVELKQEAELILGHQRLVLLGIGEATTDARLSLSKDTRPYGGPMPQHPFLALRLLHADKDGKTKAGTVMLRTGPVITVGRQGCDLNFPSDPGMAPRHLELHLRDSVVQAVTTDASGAVFLRVKEPTYLQNADEILLGEELFRVEIP